MRTLPLPARTEAEAPIRDASLGAPRAALPLTSRVLRSLPGSTGAWRLAWGLAPVAQAAVITPLATEAGLNPYGWALFAVAIPFNLVLTFCIVHALWASERLVAGARALRPALERTADAPHRDPFAGIDAARPPVVATVVIVAALAFDALRRSTVPIVLVMATFEVVTYLPIITWVWTFVMLMVGLRRLGRERLGLDTYGGDRSLGLRPVGRLAATGFWAFVANLVPILALNVTYPLGLGLGLACFLAGVIAFFLSLHGLHRQMLAVKRAAVARAQTLYADAYAPLRLDATLETLQRQSPLLGAAEALERRAEGIQTWPFTNAILARILLIASSVFTAIVTRLTLNSVGL